MKRRYTFDDAQKGVKGTPVPVDSDTEALCGWMLLQSGVITPLELNDSSTAQTDPVLPPALAPSSEPVAAAGWKAIFRQQAA